MMTGYKQPERLETAKISYRIPAVALGAYNWETRRVRKPSDHAFANERIMCDLAIIRETDKAVQVCVADDKPRALVWLPKSVARVSDMCGWLTREDRPAPPQVNYEIRTVHLPMWLYRKVWEELNK